MTTITLNLPEKTLEQARQTAVAMQRPVEDVLSDMLQSLLPTPHGAPLEMQIELTEMTWLDNPTLWQIARSEMSIENQREMQELTAIQENRILSAREESRLNQLRQEYGRTTLRKARAYALLSLRGGKPLLTSI